MNFEAIENFILDNQDNLGVSSKLVARVDEAQLDDIDIKHAFINDLPDMKIAFDVLIEAILKFTKLTEEMIDMMKYQIGSKFHVLAT